MTSENWRNKPRKTLDSKSLERLSIRVTMGEKQAIQEFADAAGLTLTAFVVSACYKAGRRVLTRPLRKALDKEK